MVCLNEIRRLAEAIISRYAVGAPSPASLSKCEAMAVRESRSMRRAEIASSPKILRRELMKLASVPRVVTHQI